MTYTDYIRQTPEGYIRVVSSADYDSIVSYTPLPDITVFVDAVVNLPNTVEATFKSGKVETMIIKWERINVDTSIAGTQKIYGDIGNGAAAVLQNVIVNELSDLYILRQIRDANPTSELPNMWLDSEDPYTQWEGVTWNDEKIRVVELDIADANVTTLINVNKLTALQYLVCAFNQLTELNVTGLTALQRLICSFNQLTALNVDGLTNLQYLDCAFNQLTELNVTGLTNLQSLHCYSNQLTELNVTGLTNLQYLDCASNQLTELNVTGLTALQELVCYSNQLTELNVTGLTNLQYLDCASNQLTALPTLTSKGSITSYNFRYNNFPTAELDRFRALGFTDESKLLPQNT